MPAINRISILSILFASLLGALLAASNPAYAAPSYASSATDPASYYSLPDQKETLDAKFPGFLKPYHDRSNWKRNKWNFKTQDGTQSSKVDLPAGKQDMHEKKTDAQPTRVAAFGFILPSGYYMWDGRIGMVPNPTLMMPGFTTPNKSKDSGYLGPTSALLDQVDPTHMLRTTSVTNGEFARIMAANSQLANEMRANPEGWRYGMRQAQSAKEAMSSNMNAAMAESSQNTGFDNTMRPLINIANEDTWVPCDPEAPWKSYGNAAWMVGQMYKQVYIPMAILLLLPGAIMTQAKVVVRTGFLFGGNSNDDDMVNPFSGILRSIIAVFLIPATQLFVSYSIDVGNSLTYEVVNFKPYFDLQLVETWRDEQTFDVKKANNLNHIPNTDPKKAEGKFFNTAEKDTKFENQSFATAQGQQWYNTLNELLGQGVIALNAFQLVMVFYLFLLGPIAASLFAWPGIFGEMFRKVYGNWMNGVVLVVLWKFWWAIILLCMSVRLQAFQDVTGGMPQPNDQFEMFTCAAFVAMLMYVPFNPFDFKPGDLVDSVLQKAQEQAGKGGHGGQATGGTGGAGNGGGGGSGAQGGAGAGRK